MFRKILSSTASNSLALAVSLVVTFVMTPVYIHELGDYDYGIWQVIMSVIGYLGLIDLGLQPTISRFTAFSFSADESKQRWDPQVVFTTSLVLMAIAGGLAGGAVSLWSIIAPHALASDSDTSGRYAMVLQLIAIRLVIAFPSFCMQSTFEGRLLYAVKNNVNIILTVLSSAFLLVFLPRFDPLILLSTTTAVVSALKLMLYYGLLSWDVYGGYRVRLKFIDRRLALEMIRFGTKSLLQSLASKGVERMPPIVISGALGPQAVVFYSLPKALLGRVAGSLSHVMTHALMPAFTHMHAAGDKMGIERYYTYGSKVTYAFTLGVSAGMGVLGDSFIRLWVGDSYGNEARDILIIMAVGMAIGGSLPLHNRMLTAMNMHGRLSLIYSVRSVLQIALMFLLVTPFGIKGVVFAGIIGVIAALPFIWKLTFSVLELTALTYIRRALAPLFVSASGMTAILILSRNIYPPTSWPVFAGHAALGAFVYGGLVWTIGFGSAERALLLRTLLRR